MATFKEEPSRESRLLVVGGKKNSLTLLLEALSRHLPHVTTEAVVDPAVAVERLAQNDYDVAVWLGTDSIPFLREAKGQGTQTLFVFLADRPVGAEDEPLLQTLQQVPMTADGGRVVEVVTGALDRVSLSRRLRQANRQSARDADVRGTEI
jgi:hypothetical protein